jgi:hypothetical protein
MRPRNELWQGYSGYWQNQFIHQNILLLGYTAWNGYLNIGRGIVVCNVIDVISPSIDWSVDTVAFNPIFISQAQTTTYLQELELDSKIATTLLNTIATYNPTQAIVVLIVSNGAVDINLLQHLKISPAECYKQVQHRWAEFQFDLTTPKRHS